MRKSLYILGWMVALLVTSCTESSYDVAELPEDDGRIAIESVTAQIDGDISTRSTDTDSNEVLYVINDPTTDAPATRSGNWNLFFDMKTIDAEGNYTKTLSTEETGYYIKGGDGSWVPQDPDQPLYFYSYMRGINAHFLLSQKTEFDISLETQSIETDQSTKDNLLNQDALYSEFSRFNPGKTLSVTLKHLHAMLDFSFDYEPDEENEISVVVGDKTYMPYCHPKEVTTDGKSHYLLILPYSLDANPTIMVTYRGTEYFTEVPIFPSASRTQLGKNTRYLFTVHGKELKIESITIAEWKVGQAFTGEYISPVAYPVFRGDPNTSYTLTYSNDLWQTVTMNLRGEKLAKPVGSKIVKIEKGEEEAVDVNVPLSNYGQLVDLEDILTKASTPSEPPTNE